MPPEGASTKRRGSLAVGSRFLGFRGNSALSCDSENFLTMGSSESIMNWRAVPTVKVDHFRP